ncbi:hypothetical protein MGN01_30930 [Methylobacterium gnaphalii]|uniref:Uncharacterized protein n=1 Tax=Methylobacterium gnaphalii TaxID=1010610 RepID=A0A512JMU6_9HYPH|nr:hypothetical protein MGN01_30930 [Methylobacterium gnaphalii]GLS49752.1 hypothetical protein GCM10007885_26020 [Methylobacterium gnaphalii]
MRKFKFSATNLARYLNVPQKVGAQVVVWDTEARGLGLIVAAQALGLFSFTTGWVSASEK